MTGKPAQPEPVDPSLRREEDPEFFEREAEEAWAARHSMSTRLLGWSMLGWLALVLVALLFGKSGTVDILMIYGGIRILQGSQAWLRYYTFLHVLVLPFAWGFLLPGLMLRSPVDLDFVRPKEWLDALNHRFWTHGVCPAMWLTADAIIAVIALRTRNLKFWTSTARRCGGIFLILSALAGIVVLSVWIAKLIEDRAFATLHADFLAKLHSDIDRGASSFLNPPVPDSVPADIQWVNLRSNPSSNSSYFRREGVEVGSSEFEEFEQFHRLPSGAWIRLDIGYFKSDVASSETGGKPRSE